MDAVKLGKRIKEARTKAGLTQAELSQLTDLTPKYLSNLECGAKTPKLETFLSLANALQCDANTLLTDSLDVSATLESAAISDKLAALPVEEQRRILRVLDVMIDEASTQQ